MFCSRCGKEVSGQGPFCSNCGASLVGNSAPCPKCGGTFATKSGFTWWGGFLGPKLFNHVKCSACGTTYNGETGKSNTTAIVMYQGIGLVLALAILGFTCWWAASLP
jgi:hypothetical protein